MFGARFLAKDPPQCRDLNCEVTLLDGEAGPCGFHQSILGDGGPRALHERAQQSDGTLSERNGLGIPKQHLRLRVEPEWAEGVGGRHRVT